MANNQDNVRSQNQTSTFGQIVGRLVTAAIVLAVTAFFTPGFTINNIWTLAIAAIVLTIIDYLIVKFTGLEAQPFGKGFVGFVLAAVTLYVPSCSLMISAKPIPVSSPTSLSTTS